MSFLQIIKNDIKIAEHWIDAEAVKIWDLAKPLFQAVEQAGISELKVFIEGVLGTIADHKVKDLATLESAVLNSLAATRPALLAIAQGLGSNLLQVIIGLVKAA